MGKNLLRRRANVQMFGIRISLQSWPIHITKPVGKTKLSYNRTLPHKSCFPSSYVVLFPIATLSSTPRKSRTFDMRPLIT